MNLTDVSTPVLAGAVIITGLVVVFVALLALWGIVALFGKVLSRPEKKDPPAPSAPVQTPKAPEPPAPVQQPMKIEDGVGDEVIAVIAAAIAAISGGTEVIHSVRQAKQRRVRSGWAQAGLMQNTQQF